MNVGKAKSYLNKINRLFAGIEEDGGSVSQIEKDLMLSYVREFYDSFIFEAEPAAAKHITPKPPVSTTKTIAPKKVITETQPKVEPIKEEKSNVVEFEIPKVETPVYVQSEILEEEIIPINFDEFDILFEEERITALSQRLGQGKITNLRTSMGINERFLIQNELFGGDSNSFNKTLDTLNDFENFVEAKAFIIKEAAPENGWLEEHRIKRAQDFIRKIRRRYKK